MNEGKPTKAKWWSRPRSADVPDGDFELERPRADRTTGTGDVEAGDGDFELERPAPRHASGTGDYELERPAPGPGEDTSAGPDNRADPDAAPHADADADGGSHPGAPARTGQDGEAAAGAPAGPVADAPAAAGPLTDVPAAVPAAPGPVTDVPAAAAPTAAGSVIDVPAAVPAAPGPAADAPAPAGPLPAAPGPVTDPPVTERPKPLHDPDPYSTPPYGEPGPWAPAPPVQHPAAAPVPGTMTEGLPAGAVPGPASADAPSPAPPVHGPAASAPGGPVAHAGTAPPAPAGAAPDPAPADAPPPAPVTVAAPSAAVTVPEQATYAAPGADTPAADPWRRYDPWAASAATASWQQSGAAVPTREQRRKRTRKAIVGAALLIALVSGGIGGGVGAYLERNGGVGTVELPQAGKEAAERAPDSVAGIAARALPSVVTLHVSGSDAAGTGTGFVLDDRGHILTNNHVVEPAGPGGGITVTFDSGDTAEATVVGRDSGYDLAVVRVKGVSGLTPMPLGNSDNVRVGDPVVAIGAPFDLAGTVTSGIISARERPITAGGEEGDGSDVSYVDALQTDAPINPGNSGGPLLDSRGRVVGINSAIRSAGSGSAESDGGQAGSIGLGFAIPINQGKRVAEELINTGKATHPVIGITLDMAYTGDGARVGTRGSGGGPAVTAGGPGAEAGIKAGDVITAVDGQRVHSGEELIVKTRAHRPGDRLELTLERDGRETNVSLVLGSSGGD
ncbi:putative protease [Streptomyces ambofaciens ATCC 23877]|uniref:Putative protease n=1 Tax=Streptomyces ambofaciens (strain ATCC 23877 / 3486 / DSM 40053 / JCM 4204 / NBRC 12836 / NRRL B-2516) TaxID=278992 RepID=A0A0K2AYD0_STRA7|nr:trypsin-like peptidase domain-containing protein [Streptomyces ambofaciens]AKZ57973.1 putative protease [Streptomyces ambofaciens ATCC 23877]